MQFANIDQYVKGWIIGDFEPSFFKNPFFEVGFHRHKAGEPTIEHTHKVTTELNFIVRGELIASGHHLKSGDMWTYEPKEYSTVEFLTDVELLVVRWPSIPSDKYIK